MMFDVAEEEEKVPLLSWGGRLGGQLRSRTCPPTTPELTYDVTYGGRSGGTPRNARPAFSILPADCWAVVLSFLIRCNTTIRDPYTQEEVQQILAVSHVETLLRTLASHTCTLQTEAFEERKELLCIAVSDPDRVHADLAEHCLMRPIRAEAAAALSRGAHESCSSAFAVLVSTANFVYISLFLPTTVTLLGLIHPTWKVWTVSIFSVLFLPLFFLGWLASKATLEWWAAANPVHLCPHVNRYSLAHCLHPTPWLRVLVIQAGTIFISFIIAYASWVLGDWLDAQPPQQTQWILLLLVLCCYCP